MKESSKEKEDNDVSKEGFGIQLPTGANFSCTNVTREGHHFEHYVEEAFTTQNDPKVPQPYIRPSFPMR